MEIIKNKLARILCVLIVSSGAFTSCIREALPGMNVDISDITLKVEGSGIVKTTIQENGVTLYADMSKADPKHLDLDVKVSDGATWTFVDVKMDSTFLDMGGGVKIFVPGTCKIDTTVVGEISAPRDFTTTRYIKVVSEREGVNPDDTLTQHLINAQNSGFIGWEKDGKRTSQYVPGAHLYKIWAVDLLPAGIPTTLTFDNWSDVMGSEFQLPYEVIQDSTGKSIRPRIWASTNASISLMAKTNKLVVYGARPTDDVAPVRKGNNKSALLLTSNDIRYTKTYQRPFLAGCCFIGEFDGSDTGALTCTHVGLPFNQKPESLSFWYKFLPATIEDPNTTPYSGFTVPGIEDYIGKQDKGFIRAVLYRADGDNLWLDGSSIRDPQNKDVIAYAEFVPEGTVSEYKKQEVKFTYVKDCNDTDLANWKYNLAIYFASSCDGFRFICGANMAEQKATKLFIDEMEINCK